MKKTALHSIHQKHNANFIEKDGWQIPGNYGNMPEEYHAIVEDVGLLDASHIGKFKASGNDALGLLNRLSTNNLLKLEPNRAMGTVLTTEKGRIVDLLITMKQGDHLFNLTSPQQILNDLKWIEKYTFPLDDTQFEDVTESVGCLMILGFSAVKVLSGLTDEPIEEWDVHQFESGKIEGVDATLMRTFNRGGPAYYLFGPSNQMHLLWSTLVDSGAQPVGYGAYEMLRIESGFPRYGHELTEAVNPLEAGLQHSVSFNKGCYVGQEVVARVDSADKIKHSLYGLIINGEALPKSAATVYAENEKNIGFVTSATRSIKRNQNLALAYLKNRDFEPGMPVIIESESEMLRATAISLPF